MSRSSKRKGRPTVPRDPGTYSPAANQHLRLLRSAGEQWDQGNHEHVIGMVTALRVLLVEKLLDRVVRLKDARMLDSALHPPERADSQFIGGGLTAIELGEGGARFVPVCQSLSPEDYHHFPTVNFHDWWERDLVVRHGRDGWTRQFLVYEMANTDGIHYDEELDNDYDHVIGPVPGLVFGSREGQRPADGVAQASLRQIAWEVAETFPSV